MTDLAALVSKLDAALERHEAIPPGPATGLTARPSASAEQIAFWDAEVEPIKSKIYDEVCERTGKRLDYSLCVILPIARRLADGGYWSEGVFSPDDDLVFFEDGTAMTQKKAMEINNRKWVKA